MKRFALIACFAVAGCGGLIDSTSEDLASASHDMGSDAATVTAQFHSLYADYLGTCASCHAPSAPGRTSDIEKTLDFSSQAMAYTTLTTGMAAGLTGPPMACNGVAFIQKGKPLSSLALAVVDETTRNTFDVPSAASCDKLTITDETVKVGSAPSAAFVTAFSDWITNGAAND
jgi:hypothetical protein